MAKENFKKDLIKRITTIALSASIVMTGLPATVFAATANDATSVETEATKDAAVYVMMNIPYAEFYKAELNNNDIDVDAFTSATKNKSRTKNGVMANGSYHVNSDGSDITGITFPVKVSDISVLKDQKQVTDEDSVTVTVTNRGQTSSNTYTGVDALFENPSYSYYVLSEAPSYYKELTVESDGSFSFGKTVGATETTVESEATLSTDSGYGDYQLDIDSATFGQNIDINSDTIYGATVNTTDGTSYGLRHVENMWKGFELAWCTGFTTSVHNCPTSSEHYKSMMGKTIDSVTYYTSKGIITFDIPDTKVVTITGVKATVADMDVDAKETTVELDSTLPSDFAAEYSVEGEKVSCENGKIAVSGLEPGSHSLAIKDTSNNYATIYADFNVTTQKMPASYDATNKKLVAASGYTADELTSYIGAITAVTVDGTRYAATGRKSKIIIKEDGTLDLTDLTVTDDSEFVVEAEGYANNLTFQYADRYFKLNASSKTLYTAGSSKYTKVTLKASTNLKDKVTWKSSNTKYATVSSSGVVTAKKKGTVTITATCGSYNATCKVTVKSPSLKVNKTSIKLKKGKKTTIKATGTPSGKVTYKSSKKKVATVSSKGVVKGKKKGTAKIYVTCNGVKKTVKVKVK